MQMIRSFACPSLVSLQFGYAQTFVEGRAFVRDVLLRMSVEELVRNCHHFPLSDSSPLSPMCLSIIARGSP